VESGGVASRNHNRQLLAVAGRAGLARVEERKGQRRQRSAGRTTAAPTARALLPFAPSARACGTARAAQAGYAWPRAANSIKS